MSNFMATFVAHSGSIAASTTDTSEAIKIARGKNFSIVVDSVSGTSPNYDVSYTIGTTEDGTFIAPATDNVIINDATTTKVVAFTPVPAQYIKILTVNNNASNALTITVKLIMQEE